MLLGSTVVGEDLVGDADGFDTYRGVLHGGDDVGNQHAFVIGFDQNDIVALAGCTQGFGVEGGDGGAVEDSNVHICGSRKDTSKGGSNGDNGCFAALLDYCEFAEADGMFNGIGTEAHAIVGGRTVGISFTEEMVKLAGGAH